MSLRVASLTVRKEQDIVTARGRAWKVAGLLGLDKFRQTAFGTAVSEMVRCAWQVTGEAELAVLVEENDRPQLLVARVSDPGGQPAQQPGPVSSDPGTCGSAAARKLVDYFHVEPSRLGTVVVMAMLLPKTAPLVTRDAAGRTAAELALAPPATPLAELRARNLELLDTMCELKRRQDELRALSRELEDTDRGIVALYAELDNRANHLATANARMSRFLSYMSHEIRTPLTSILSLARLLADGVDGELSTEQSRQVGYIRKSAQDLTELVNDLLDLGGLDTGKIVVHPARFDLSRLFAALHGTLRPILSTPGVELVFEEPEGIPPLYTDEGKLTQILHNLVSNAMKFTEKGEIRVQAGVDESRGEIRLSVRDTGIGIGAEDLPRVFEEYEQVQTHLQRKVKGTGLGLPLSRRLATLLGGRIEAASTPGEGSTFSVVLPARYAAAPPADGRAEAATTLAGPVLVIEDDTVTSGQYEKSLVAAGLRPICVSTLEAARVQMARTKPAAIVLDLMLAGQDSWGFLAGLRGNEETRPIPVFASSLLEDHETCFSLGADEVVTKPVDRNWLHRRVRDASRHAPLETVLVIDDEEIPRYLLKGLLQEIPVAVLEAASGEEGIRLAVERRPGLVLLDLLMPGMDGFDTLARLKGSPVTARTPVVVVTSRALPVIPAQEDPRLLSVFARGTGTPDVVVSRIRDSIGRVAIVGW